MDEKKYELEYKITDEGQINTNIITLKKDLEDQLRMFEDYSVEDETQVKEGKTYLGNLRKIRKGIDEEKKKIKKEFMKPYNEFEKHVKDMFKMIDEPINSINKQIKEYEEMWKQDKYDEIKDYFDSYELSEVTLDMIFDNRWYNKTYTTKKWQEDIDELVMQIVSDLSEIENADVEDNNQLKLDYLNNGLDLEKAYRRYEDRVSSDDIQKEEQEEYVTIKKSRYDELLEIEKEYYKLKGDE